MNRMSLMRARLEQEFSPIVLHIIDESAHHAGHAGASPHGETHFAVEISSARFTGLSKVAQHRLVYASLAEFFAQGLHALSIQTFAPVDEKP